MNIFSHIIIAISSLLGWNVHYRPPLPIPTFSTTTIASSSVPAKVKKEDKPTIARSNAQLPYLKIVAPEFKQLPVQKIESQPPVKNVPVQVQPPVPANQNNDFVVNIFCTIRNGNTIEYITGSGAIIDPKGVILTNSHVAQYVLISDYLNTSNRNCVARTGSPATNTYNVKVLYISPAWVKNNIKTISEEAPQGTGQSDYAFLYITGYTNSLQQAATYPYIALGKDNLNSDDIIKVYGYPAGSANGNYVKNSLSKVTDTSTISDIYSFTGDQATDLIIAPSNKIAERGSSGGPILENNYIEGIITTSLQNNGAKSFSAITGEYINRDFQNNAGYSLNTLLSGDLEQKSSSFETSTGFSLARDLISNNP